MRSLENLASARWLLLAAALLPVAAGVRPVSAETSPASWVPAQTGEESEARPGIPLPRFHKSPSRPNSFPGRHKSEARDLLERGQPGSAYRLLMSALSENRNDPAYLGLLAVSALHSGNAVEASVVYERLITLQPTSGRWWVGLALARQRQGLDPEPVYREMLAWVPADSELAKIVRQSIGALG